MVASSNNWFSSHHFMITQFDIGSRGTIYKLKRESYVLTYILVNRGNTSLYVDICNLVWFELIPHGLEIGHCVGEVSDQKLLLGISFEEHD